VNLYGTTYDSYITKKPKSEFQVLFRCLLFFVVIAVHVATFARAGLQVFVQYQNLGKPKVQVRILCHVFEYSNFTHRWWPGL